MTTRTRRRRPMIEPTPEQIRATVERLAAEQGESLAALSRMLRRNDAYLQQFVKRGSPKRLPEDARLLLAQFFGVDERELGARDPWMPGEEAGR